MNGTLPIISLFLVLLSEIVLYMLFLYVRKHNKEMKNHDRYYTGHTSLNQKFNHKTIIINTLSKNIYTIDIYSTILVWIFRLIYLSIGLLILLSFIYK